MFYLIHTGKSPRRVAVYHKTPQSLAVLRGGFVNFWCIGPREDMYQYNTHESPSSLVLPYSCMYDHIKALCTCVLHLKFSSDYHTAVL